MKREIAWRIIKTFLALGWMVTFPISMVYSQSVLKRFQAHQVHQDILLSWTLETGKVCNGIRILRADDPGSGFEEIFYIGGVCGSIQDTVAYDYYDTQTPEKSPVYYLLDLNELGLSDTLRAEWFAHGTGDLVLYFDVVAGSIRLVSAGQGQFPLQLHLFTSQGSLAAVYELESSETVISNPSLPSGWYFCHIISEDNQLLAIRRLRIEP